MYYTHAVDPNMLVTLNSLVVSETKDTSKTVRMAMNLLKYTKIHMDASIHCQPSNMKLHIHNNTSYLAGLEAKSRGSGRFFRQRHAVHSKQTSRNKQKNPIHTECFILRIILASVEGELTFIFMNAQTIVGVRTALSEMGLIQLPKLIKTNNSATFRISNKTVR